ncbi:MAG TPA: type IV secretion system DNA-binding domain-containing protein [Pirellulales bacterium]|nr:type IV secretion system DNA-binding domain-containing protein [Pirellulales bacterium]
MNDVFLGKEVDTGEQVSLPWESFKTHYHLIGGTGKGKTTAIHSMVQQLLCNPIDDACFFIIDKLGNFTSELLLWMASHYCPDYVRDRLVFIQAANEDMVSPLNPFIYETPGEGFYKVERATDLILRAWESQNIEAMPRLGRWLFNAFWAAAQLGLTISDCVHFLRPGSEFHRPLLDVLPPLLKSEWHDIMRNERSATEILDSTRNRLRPYFESVILRRMFGSNRSRLDVARMMKEGRIVLVDLAPHGRIGDHLATTIGAMIINEILATVRGMPIGVRYPTYLLLDEFQNFVGPDVESALPELRNLGLRMILSHQSLSQLRRGDYDMTNIIFQAQSRMIFGVQGRDADLLAQEIASIKFDPYEVKDERWTLRQINAGNKIMELHGHAESDVLADNWGKTWGSGWGKSDQQHGDPFSLNARKNVTSGRTESGNDGRSEGGNRSRGTTDSTHETLVPVYRQFQELANRSYFSFDDKLHEWGGKIRRLNRGRTLLRVVDDDRIRLVDVERSAPGFLEYDIETIVQEFPWCLDDMNALIERNFQSDYFMPAAQIDREALERIERVVRPPLNVGPGVPVTGRNPLVSEAAIDPPEAPII